MTASASSHERARRVVLLDVDGTLVDSNGLHADAWADALREAGHAIPAARVRPLIGMGGDNLLPALGLDAESAASTALLERRGEIFQERYLPRVRAFPGARALLERLRDDFYTLVVASSASDTDLRGLLDAAAIADLLDGTTSASDAEHSKPDPDIVTAALRRAGAPAREAFMLGDTPYDVTAATAAGVALVAVRCGGWDDGALRGALAVYDDPAALLAAYDDSPFAR